METLVADEILFQADNFGRQNKKDSTIVLQENFGVIKLFRPRGWNGWGGGGGGGFQENGVFYFP